VKHKSKKSDSSSAEVKKDVQNNSSTIIGADREEGDLMGNRGI
jgi:hypothetical protein